MFDQPKQSIGFKFFQNYTVYLLLFVECTTVHIRYYGKTHYYGITSKIL